MAADLAPAPFAVPVPAPQNHRFYAAFGAGLSFEPDQTWTYFDQNHTYRFDTGFMGEAAVGLYLPWNFRAEIEGAYRRNESNHDQASLGGPFNTHGPLSATSVMANLLYDFDLGGRFGVFAGGGIATPGQLSPPTAAAAPGCKCVRIVPIGMPWL